MWSIVNENSGIPHRLVTEKSDSDFWSGERWGWIARELPIPAEPHNAKRLGFEAE